MQGVCVDIYEVLDTVTLTAYQFVVEQGQALFKH